jgi:LPXTG-site transpeptidase (sortase) family protein
MKTHRIILIAGITVLVAGMATLAPFVYFGNKHRAALANATPTVVIPVVAPKPEPKPTTITGYPVRLQVPSLNIDLQIVDGVYSDKSHSWSLSRDKVHYALPTVQPNNEAGNTLLYGHYRPEVFAKLHKIAVGAEAIVTTDNGHTFTYKLQEVSTVDPTDTSVFTYEGAPRLTIQTCTGAWMQDRQLFYFDLTATE